jgi:phosphonate transport system substrate-binding protein
MPRPTPLVLVVAAFALAAAARAETKPLAFGIPKPYDAVTTKGDATLLEGYLSAALKRPVQAKTFDTYDQLAEALGKGELDIAWITPLAYVKAGRTSAVIPIAKALRKGLFYRSCVYVRSEATATKLADLKGTKAAWVDPTSTSGYLFPRGMLLKEGQKPSGFFGAESFAGDHKSACAAVLGGQADVGATYTDADGAKPGPTGCGDALGAEALTKLRCLAVSDRIPNEVIAGRAGLDDALVGDLGRIFAQLSDTESGRKVLAAAFRADGFGLALEEDFDAVRLVAQSVEAGKWIDKKPERSRAEFLLNTLDPAADAKKDQKAPAKKDAPVKATAPAKKQPAKK